jgi:PIN domain
MAIQKLLFVDTNIWLDFYRARTDAGLKLLKHLEKVSGQIVVTYQLEMEFKKNRQGAIAESLNELKPPQHTSRPGLFSDAKAVKSLEKGLKTASQRVDQLKERLRRALENPASYDPVYQTCQRVFHRESDLVLTRNDPIRRVIRRRAFRRFIMGCPPRKKNDTSIGDAMNWEWMVECALNRTAELVIVTRDSDYGSVIGNRAYINDHLRQEFSERVSNKRKVLLYPKLSEALKHFQVAITEQETKEEELLVSTRPSERGTGSSQFLEMVKQFTNSAPAVTHRSVIEDLLVSILRSDEAKSDEPHPNTENDTK